MANMGAKILAKTRDDEESGMAVGLLFDGVVDPAGPPAVGPDVGAGVQSSGVPELGGGAVGVVVVGGVGLPVGDGDGPGVAETVMASFWPAWQCRPNVQM